MGLAYAIARFIDVRMRQDIYEGAIWILELFCQPK